MKSPPGHNGTGPSRRTPINLGNVSSRQKFSKRRKKHPRSMLSASAQGPARLLLVGEQCPTSSPRGLREKLRSNNDQAFKNNLKVRPELLTLIWVCTDCSLIHFPYAIQLNIVKLRFFDCILKVHCYRGVNNINMLEE